MEGKRCFIILFFVSTLFLSFSDNLENKLISMRDDFENITWYEDVENNLKSSLYESDSGLDYNIFLRCLVTQDKTKKLYLYIKVFHTIDYLVFNIDGENFVYLSGVNNAGTTGLANKVETENKLSILKKIASSKTAKFRVKNNFGYYADFIVNDYQKDSLQNVLNFYLK